MDMPVDYNALDANSAELKDCFVDFTEWFAARVHWLGKAILSFRNELQTARQVSLALSEEDITCPLASRVTNTSDLDRCKTSDIEAIIVMNQFRWACHVSRKLRGTGSVEFGSYSVKFTLLHSILVHMPVIQVNTTHATRWLSGLTSCNTGLSW